jgi:hypothetical protein
MNRKDEQTDERTKWQNEQSLEERENGETDKTERRKRRTEERKNGRTEERKDGRTEERKNGREEAALTHVICNMCTRISSLPNYFVLKHPYLLNIWH